MMQVDQKRVNELAEAIAPRITALDGIGCAHPLMTIRAYSRYHLEHMFSIGTR
ncbi:hypothetical protein HQ520_09350 [bacterium]|nr:hypothetical protein [bacterium]